MHWPKNKKKTGSKKAKYKSNQREKVEARPLTQSKGQRLREERGRIEIQTEEKIVERLELDRLKDEKRRAQKLFDNHFQKPEPQLIKPEVQVIQAEPTIVMDREESILDREALKNEISAKVRNELSTENSSESKKYYMAGTIGMADYSATNVQSKMGGWFFNGYRCE